MDRVYLLKGERKTLGFIYIMSYAEWICLPWPERRHDGEYNEQRFKDFRVMKKRFELEEGKLLDQGWIFSEQIEK